MNLFSNPLCSAEFLPVTVRFLILFGVGAAILVPVLLRVSGSMKQELIARYKSWAIIAPIFLVSVFCGTIPSLIIFGLILLRAVSEFAAIAKLPNSFRFTMIALIPLSCAAVGLNLETALIPVIFLLAFAITALKTNNPK